MSNFVTQAVSRYVNRYREVAQMQPRLKPARAYVNWLRSNWELRAGSARIGARPLKLTIDPTNVCQLRCPLCPTGLEIHDRKTGHAPLNLLEKLLDEVGDYVFFIDFFNWGEPLLNPRLHEFIRLADSHQIQCTVSTNLSLPLTDERIRQLVSSGLRELIVSLDGASPGTYETYRRRGKFDLVVDNMRRIVQAKRELGLSMPLISWQFLVFGFNEHEVDQARRMAGEIGVDRILVRPAALDVDRFPLSEEDQKQMANWQPKEPLYQIENIRPSATKHHSRCGWHYMSAAINWDGSVAPCCTVYEKEHDFGTLAVGDSYMDIANNGAFRAVRERFAGRRKEPVTEVCEQCPTPGIMDYHEFLNRQVLLFSAVALIERIRGIWGGGLHRPVRASLPHQPLAPG